MARRITLKHIRQWLAEGRGVGHGSAYIPWIKITTRGMPGDGNLQYRYIPELNRYGHLLSAGELHLVRLLLYLGVADLREQFPCWPWPSPHPLYLHPNFNPPHVVWCAGTIATAKKLGIQHPIYPGTKLLHIPTIDVLATVRSSPNYRAVAFAVKPDPDKVKLSEWDASKLLIQATYCKELNIPWHLISAENIPETLRENLKALFHHSAPNPDLEHLLPNFSNALNSELQAGLAIAKCIERTRIQLGLSHEIGNELFHRALWFKTISVDLRDAWVLSEPAHLCNMNWIKATRDYLLGENQS